jgi:hypothetical protein
VKIPDFSEFAKSVDVDAIGKQIDEMNTPHIIQFNQSDKKATENAITMIYQQSVQAAVGVSLLYLQAYHEWLQKQLDE